MGLKQLTFKDKQRTLFSRVAQLRKNATQSELVLKEKLGWLGIKSIFQKAFIQGEFYCIVDFYIPKPYKIAIEVDGGYHLTEEQKRKDWAKDKYLNGRGIKVIRLLNEEAESITISNIQKLIGI